jgi:hypothetical protein
VIANYIPSIAPSAIQKKMPAPTGDRIKIIHSHPGWIKITHLFIAPPGGAKTNTSKNRPETEKK